MGFAVITANTQKDGEKLIEKTKPDLAIFDLMMDNQDSGFILSYKLKQLYPEVPVILATAVTASTGMEFGIETAEDRNWIKADLYLAKGIRPDQLHREINKLLKL
jgi:CheY-like chemotaxis protein